MIDNIIKRIVQEKIYDIHTSVIGEVVRVGVDTLDVKPLLKRKYKDGIVEDYPVLVNLPYRKESATVTIPEVSTAVIGGPGGIVIPERTLDIDFRQFEVGDKVVVVFSERAIDGVGGRNHSLSDGMVVARL